MSIRYILTAFLLVAYVNVAAVEFSSHSSNGKTSFSNIPKECIKDGRLICYQYSPTMQDIGKSRNNHTSQKSSSKGQGRNVSAGQSSDVILYATTWCQYCQKTRQLFRKNNIPYTEYDVEKSSTHYAQFKRLGGQGVPLININGTVVKGYNPQRILKLAAD